VDSAAWYLIFKADAFDWLFESNQQNNIAVAPIAFELSPPANLGPIEFDERQDEPAGRGPVTVQLD
jgi:hypothetical protein